ncbi:hypothetical protein [Jatrophihabitans sp.]|uniref:hypothetical protein n=1 Tax=Jatrophihabitans sp. TaxID=1932789 RepID=UPI002BFA639A|nr:hypothetical protein [Jatrophihabitans sp.]
MAESNDEQIDQFIIFAGYGEVMHRFQLLEMGLWGLLSKSIKPATTMDQAIAKVKKWNGTTLGELMRGMKGQTHWPPELLAKLLRSVEIRNYLAHHFLREYFIAERSMENRKTATQELADLANWLDALSAELDDHLATQGITTLEVLDPETAAEIDALRPKDWLYFIDQ